jgi:DNA primase
MSGRIPQGFLDDLLDRIDIVEVIDRRVKLKKTGKNYSARCPFHDEKTPSFSVNPDKQFYYCFGCGAGGNALTFVMEYENLEFPQAVDNLASGAGMEVPREQSRGGPGQQGREDNNKPLYALMAQVRAYYEQQLRKHAEAHRAVDYLKGRGLTGEIAKRFSLGFAPPGWGNLLDELGSSEEQKSLLLKAGMLVKNEKGRLYDRFRDRVVFPIRDRRGRVIAFGGRVLGDDKPKYLNSPETPIFHKGRELYGLYEARQAHKQLERILVVEGYMDVIALAQHGITYATATLGTATSQTHLEQIYRLSPEVVFCFDGDEAGRKAALRALEAALPCMEDGRQARFLFLPEGQDPDDAVRNGGRDLFEALLDQAVPLENFLFETVGKGLDLSSLEGRARMSKQALPYIRQLPEGVYQQLMFQALADRTGLELTSLMKLEAPPPPPLAPESAADKTMTPDQGPPPDFGEDFGDVSHYDQSDAPPVPDRTTQAAPDAFAAGYANMAQSAMALLLHRPDLARESDPSNLDGLEGPDMALLRELLQLLQKRPDSSTAMLLGHWYGTTEGRLLSQLAGQERLIPSEGIERQFTDTMLKLAEEMPHRAKFAAQVDKMKVTNYAEVSELEKQRLRELLQEKLARDTRRSKPR